jgi:hypothetical protein
MKPGAKLGPYEVVAPLGAGGMGGVSAPKDTKLGRNISTIHEVQSVNENFQ